MLFIGFLKLNLAVAFAAAIAVFDLRHDGFENRKREEGQESKKPQKPKAKNAEQTRKTEKTTNPKKYHSL